MTLGERVDAGQLVRGEEPDPFRDQRGRVRRRVLMPRTHYHVYYTVDDDARLVRVHAIGHASRGQSPP